MFRSIKTEAIGQVREEAEDEREHKEEVSKNTLLKLRPWEYLTFGNVRSSYSPLSPGMAFKLHS